MIPKRAWIAAALLACLSACSQFPARPSDAARQSTSADQLALQGQLSVKLQAFQGQEAKGLSMGFFFNGGPQGGQLDLMTPMGSQVARVHWTDADAWLQTDQGNRHFDTLGELSQEVLGEPLPLAALMHWVQGRPAPGLPDPINTQAKSFEQSGWQIDTTEIGIGRLIAQRPASTTLRGITVRIRLDR
ncbi:MAG: lipoprotein insertase outer membrane protein LolB [Aquabacterium sp.]|uniref:outer membrane lipoprotein LolB n=1 Tax=Aquabacterium sp. TaxID=1872578 RepID=UPI00271EDE20|nr:lipoprotein insertase outer membrane protein LolB [Aquabacterium sp.]MDO9004925.1 lipoprotein insertase outer membrane protein LolB [Aquabacterium sp.]